LERVESPRSESELELDAEEFENYRKFESGKKSEGGKGDDDQQTPRCRGKLAVVNVENSVEKEPAKVGGDDGREFANFQKIKQKISDSARRRTKKSINRYAMDSQYQDQDSSSGGKSEEPFVENVMHTYREEPWSPSTSSHNQRNSKNQSYGSSRVSISQKNNLSREQHPPNPKPTRPNLGESRPKSPSTCIQPQTTTSNHNEPRSPYLSISQQRANRKSSKDPNPRDSDGNSIAPHYSNESKSKKLLEEEKNRLRQKVKEFRNSEVCKDYGSGSTDNKSLTVSPSPNANNKFSPITGKSGKTSSPQGNIDFAVNKPEPKP
jgi:hypothetical protein